MSEQPTPSMKNDLPPTPPSRGGVGYALHSLMRTRIVSGLLIVAPIWVTWVICKFVFDLMRSVTEPIAWWVTQRVQQGVTVVPTVSTAENKLHVQAEVLRAVIHDSLSRDSGLTLNAADKSMAVESIVRKLNYMLDQIPDASAGVLSEHTLTWLVPCLAVLLTLVLFYMLGMFTANVFGRRMIAAVEQIFERLPFIKTVYKSIKQIVLALGGFQGMHFQRVVLIDFPAPGYKRVAFLTSVMTDQDTGRRIASIFIPYTPYLTTGYMQLVPIELVSQTDWTVEQAVKWVMSGGLIHPDALPFEQVHPVQVDEMNIKADEQTKPSAMKNNS